MKLFRTYQYLAVFCFTMTLFTTSVHAEIIRTLKLGSEGGDVKELQVFLNSNPETALAFSGVGSIGQETGYFGVLTKQAVEKFQQKYAPEVLFPAGVYSPTGIVGPYTSKKVNSLLTISEPQSTPVAKVSSLDASVLPKSAQTVVPMVTGAATTQKSNSTLSLWQKVFGVDVSGIQSLKNAVQIYRVSVYQAKHGDNVSISGDGFTQKTNTVYFGPNYHIDSLQSVDGKTLSFIVPSSVPNGSYNLWVQNENGSTLKPSGSSYFVLTDSPSPAPEITEISPNIVSLEENSTVVITGKGFARTGNTLYGSLGVAQNISSDGTSITVPLSAFSGYGNLLKNKTHFTQGELPVFIVVRNNFGVSIGNVSFAIQF